MILFLSAFRFGDMLRRPSLTPFLNNTILQERKSFPLQLPAAVEWAGQMRSLLFPVRERSFWKECVLMWTQVPPILKHGQPSIKQNLERHLRHLATAGCFLVKKD